MGLMRFLIILIQAIGLLLLVRVVGRAVARVLHPPSLAGRPESRAVPGSTDLVRDRVCNTFIPRTARSRRASPGRPATSVPRPVATRRPHSTARPELTAPEAG